MRMEGGKGRAKLGAAQRTAEQSPAAASKRNQLKIVALGVCEALCGVFNKKEMHVFLL